MVLTEGSFGRDRSNSLLYFIQEEQVAKVQQEATITTNFKSPWALSPWGSRKAILDMMSKLLANGTAVVTKAGSSTALDFQENYEDISDLTVTGLGRAIAIAFARDGCSNLALGDLSLAELEETQKTLQGQFNFLKIEVKTVDLNDETSTAEFFQLIVNRFGKIDFVVNIASYEPPVAAVHEIEESDFDHAFTANQRSIFLSSKSALGHMIKQDILEGAESRGSIVNVTSIAGTAALLGLNAYSASMAGVLGMSKSDAFDYAKDRIRVNVVAPLFFSRESVAATIDEHPFNRHATPEDVANAVVFLSGPRAAFISGIALPVDGGFHLRTGGPPRF
ncbi:hypothetical protein LTR72_007391 [Exophiala xenobiotica]|nr:hypothetical protein LTR41_006296 [Exophiala xenobiotica]KAK5219860.1 hypothetical protein LTR72_007391 [Exophiala xenobiotica]KAK5292677.1 hypothetical protein LTR14_005026 [Exophiala xenobiotica]KAK5404207.1 hypothetical protein LTR06_010140 [Exophiala xenobiotica]KAK5484279.1 hypothetical protein LTR55_005775 [Exophiala xenobiotica]